MLLLPPRQHLGRGPSTTTENAEVFVLHIETIIPLKPVKFAPLGFSLLEQLPVHARPLSTFLGRPVSRGYRQRFA